MKRRILFLLFSLGSFCLTALLGILIGYYMASSNPNIEVLFENKNDEKCLLKKTVDLEDRSGDESEGIFLLSFASQYAFSTNI